MTGKLLDLPIDLVDDGTNVRSKVDADLRRSIEEVGILQPITVTPRPDDRYDVLYGHRRLAAARAAGLRTIPAVVQAEPADLPLRQLIENQQRRAVDPLDVARTLRRYLDEHPGMRQGQLAKILGRSSHWVSTRLVLLEMDPELQRQVSAGEMRGDQAYHAHKAATAQEGRGRPRSLKSTSSGSARVVVELEGPNGRASNQATIDVDRTRGQVELLLEDTEGYGVMVTLSPAATRLLALRLSQAYQAVETVKVA